MIMYDFKGSAQGVVPDILWEGGKVIGDGRDHRYFTCPSQSRLPRQTSTATTRILDAIHLSHPPVQCQFTLLQSLQRLPPGHHLLSKLWSRRQRPNAHSSPLASRHKTTQPVFPPPLFVVLEANVTRFDTQDGLYDCAWSEVHENQLVTASGDGSVKLFDITLKVSRVCGNMGIKRVGIPDTELEGTFTGGVLGTLVTDREIYIRLFLMGHNNQNCTSLPHPLHVSGLRVIDFSGIRVARLV